MKDVFMQPFGIRGVHLCECNASFALFLFAMNQLEPKKIWQGGEGKC